MRYNWTCPHCERHVTIVDSNHSINIHQMNGGDKSWCHATTTFVKCPNPACEQVTFSVLLVHGHYTQSSFVVDRTILNKRLVPDSKAKHFPDYVPTPIIGDYTEACLIAELSPKASATLSRRCLQGMIHDFWGVATGNLGKEIEKIKDKVDPETFGAIDAVRSIGNIGAHMEKDINLILDVEPHEAELLIGLIETLISEWYVARYERSERMSAIKAAAESKKEVKDEFKNPLAELGAQ